jgi:hypothetical protein
MWTQSLCRAWKETVSYLLSVGAVHCGLVRVKTLPTFWYIYIYIYFKIYIEQTVHTVRTGINYNIIHKTNLNKYLLYGTNGTE